MTQNPWLPAAPAPTPIAPVDREIRWTPGAEVSVSGGLPVVPLDGPSATRLWVVGAHGGAGATVWARLLRCGDAGVAWPLDGEPIKALVVARTHRTGLRAAQLAAIQWASGSVRNVEMLGLLLNPDAPGKPIKELRDFTKLVSGAYPKVWTAPWMNEWRSLQSADVNESRAVSNLVRTITNAAHVAV